MTNSQGQQSDDPSQVDDILDGIDPASGDGPSSTSEDEAPTIEIDIADSADLSGSGGNDAAAKIKEAEDRTLRAQAELENFRRRVRREMDEERKFANQPLLSDLLPVIDNLHRALAAAEANPDSNGLLEGVNMVAQTLAAALEKHHCKKIEAIGKPFDPNLHEAIQQMPSEYESGNVSLVVQEGYVLHDRVIRPAQAVISTGPADA